MQGLLDFLNTPQGMGLVSGLGSYAATARKGTPINNIGRGLLGGVMGYQQAQENQFTDQIKQSQLEQFKQAQAAKVAQQAALASAPDDIKQAVAMGVPIDKVWDRMNPAPEKPQLVEVADPKDPLRTIKQWMRPGENTGVTVGYGALPEILDPRVQAAKTSIARAGAANQVIKMPAMETEENKAVGKALGDTYTSIQNSGLKAQSTLNNLSRFEQLAEGVSTGRLAGIAKDVASIGESFGIKIDPNLGDAQALESLSNEMALSARGDKMPGAMSDADRQYLQNIVPGLTKTPDGNRKIIETTRRLAKRDAEIARMAVAYRQKNRTLDGFAQELQLWSDKNPLFSDLMPKGPSVSGKIGGNQGGWSATVVTN